MIPQLSLSQQTALIDGLAKQRLRRFRAATTGDRDAIALYLLDTELTAHLHAAVRFAEIALREAIHRALSQVYGERWFQEHRTLFDETADAGFAEAERVVGLSAPSGKIIAQVMFGTWVSLFRRGGNKRDGTRAYYVEDLWEPALKTGFSVPRSDIRSVSMRVNWARNRISHCEPVVFGFPMPGLGSPGVQVRRSPAVIFADIHSLLRSLSPDLAAWFDRWESTKKLFEQPLGIRALDHIALDPGIHLDR